MTTHARKPGRNFAGVILVLLSLGAIGQAADASPADLPTLAAAQARLTSIAGRFTWTVQHEGEQRRQIGSFALARAEAVVRYEVKMSNPDGSELKRWCSDGTQAWQIEQLLEGEPADVQALENPDIRRVIACVLLDLPALERDFTPAYDAATGVLLLTPKPETKNLAAVHIRLDGVRPVEVILDDPQDGRIVVALSDIVQDQPIEERRFRVK